MSLGARRLSIIDVAGGHQPLANESGTVWAVLNGEIYNYPSIRADLLRARHNLRTRTDTEALVHLYEEYGNDLVHVLEGMYAFAVWDERKGKLLLGRDRFGEKPLYYCDSGEAISFGSEISVLANLPGTEIDAAALDEYFVFGYVPGPGTILTTINQLPAAHTLTWTRGEHGIRLARYWEPVVSSGEAPAPTPVLIEQATELLSRAVKSRLMSDAPLGVFLSGGVDSTIVAALAARHAGSDLRTFTVAYDVGAVSEANPARVAAKALGTEHMEMRLTQAELAEHVTKLLTSLDQPLADQSMIATNALAAFARQHVKVIVGGEGADELFGGYPRYLWLDRAAWLHEHLPARALRVGGALAGGAPARFKVSRLQYVLGDLPILERHLDWVTQGRFGLRSTLYGPRLLSFINDGGLVKRLTLLSTGSINSTPSARLMLLDQRHWLPDNVLAKADRASMLASLELRTPFLSREVAEFAALVPARLHVAADGKQLLRGVLKNIVPSGLWRRPKTAFRVPMAEWLRGPLAPKLAAIEDSPLIKEGWIAARPVMDLVADHASGRRDWAPMLWPVLVASTWFERSPGRAT